MDSSLDRITVTKRGLPLLLFCVVLAWCYFETLALMDTSGGAVGFHPCVILAFPAGLFLSLVLAAWAIFQKSLTIGLGSILPVLILSLPLCYAYELGIYGWSIEIRENSKTNEAAIKAVDFSKSRFDEVPYKDHERMIEVPGFRWSNSDEMTGAKNGVFFGFEVDSVPHVYVCPLMNGARGIAWVTDASKTNNDPNVKYENTGVAQWCVWTLSL